MREFKTVVGLNGFILVKALLSQETEKRVGLAAVVLLKFQLCVKFNVLFRKIMLAKLS